MQGSYSDEGIRPGDLIFASSGLVKWRVGRPCSVEPALSTEVSDPPLQACGVDYEVKAFCAENLEEKIHKR